MEILLMYMWAGILSLKQMKSNIKVIMKYDLYCIDKDHGCYIG